MAVADVYSALTEDRPYRKGMNQTSAIDIINNMVTSGALDRAVVKLLQDNINSIDAMRRQSQTEANAQYQHFLAL